MVCCRMAYHMANLCLNHRTEHPVGFSCYCISKRLFELACTGEFWLSITFSLLRIIGGFLAACIAGILLAALSAKFKYVEQFLAPFMLTVKAVPVASFCHTDSNLGFFKNLSIIISFLIVLPVIYTNIKDGISSCDKQLLEMAQVFRISPMRKIRYIYISQIMPFFRAACSISLDYAGSRA